MRYLAPVGDRDANRWVVEGLTAFGPLRYAIQAGMSAGAVLPGALAVLSIVYGWINNWFAPASFRAPYGPGRLWELLLLYGGPVVVSTVILGGVGGLFAWLRRYGLRWGIRIRQSPVFWMHRIVDTRFIGALIGWGLYASWALWPRGDGSDSFSGALHHPWLWVWFGVLWSAYMHRGHNVFLYRRYYRRWSLGCTAVVTYFLNNMLNVASHLSIDIDEKSGEVAVRKFPRDEGSGRLADLIRRIPGVQHVIVDESGPRRRSGREVITLHVREEERRRLPMVTAGRTLFALGGLSGVFVYVGGCLYALARGKFFLWSYPIVSFTFQVEAVGLIVGYGLRYVLVRRAQRELPAGMDRALHLTGKRLRGFRRGRKGDEARVTVDVTRREAEEHLVPVAARYGLKRLLVETSSARR